MTPYEAAFYHVSNHPHRLTNTFIYSWESDVFSISDSGYAYEIEIKVSRSDFKADFKKSDKHLRLSKASNGWYNWRGGKNHHHVSDRLYAESTFFKPMKIGAKSLPNKFYYCVPEGLVSKDEVPEYAGLIYAIEGGKPVVVKPAPFLHKEKPDVVPMLFDKYYWLYKNQYNENQILKQQIKKMQP